MIYALAFLSAFALRLTSLFPSLSPWNARLLTDAYAGRPGEALWSDPLFPLVRLAAGIVPIGTFLFRSNLFLAFLAGLTALALARALFLLFPPPDSPQTFAQMEDARWRRAWAWACALALASFPPVAVLFRAPGPDALAPVLLLAALTVILNPARRVGTGKSFSSSGALKLTFTLGLGTGASSLYIGFIPGLLDLALSPPHRDSFIPRTKTGRTKAFVFPLVAFMAGFFLMRPGLAADMIQSGPGLDRFLDGIVSIAQGCDRLGSTTLSAIKALAAIFSPAGLLLGFWGAYKLSLKSEERARAFGLLIAGAVLALPWAVPAERGTPAGYAGLSGVALLFGLLAAYGVHDLGLRFFRRRSWGLALVAVSVGAGLAYWDRPDLHARDLGANLFQSIPPGAHFVSRADGLDAILGFAQKVEGRRPDVSVLKIRDTEGGPLATTLERLSDADPDRLLFFDSDRSVPGEDLLPYGLASRYFPSRDHRLVNPPAQISLLRFTFLCYRRAAARHLSRVKTGSPSFAIVQRYIDAHLSLAAKCREFGLDELYRLENLAALSISRRNYQARKNLGEEALARKDFAQAVTFFQDALKTNAEDADLYFQLGQALRGSGHALEALQAFKRAVDLAPEFREARRNLALSQDETRRHDDAVVEWKRLMDGDPQDKDTVWRLVQAYHQAGRVDKAREFLREYFLLPLTPEEKSRAETFYDAVAGRFNP